LKQKVFKKVKSILSFIINERDKNEKSKRGEKLKTQKDDHHYHQQLTSTYTFLSK